jgi:molybdate transport system permease protein
VVNPLHASLFGPLWLSLQVATVATTIVLPLAAMTALLLERRRFPGKRLVETLVELPLVLPPTAVGLALLLLLGRDGPLGPRRLGLDLGLLFTWRGAVLAAAVMSFPLVVRTARVAFAAIDPRLEQMAATLGLGRWAILRRVTLPLATRGLAAAGLLGFSRALGEFGATVLVAGSIPGATQTLALALFEDIQAGRDQRALVLLAVAVVLAFLLVSAAGRLTEAPRREAGANQGTAR